MAVYKSTFNYPFMNNIEIRTALTNASSTYPVQFLTCKVDTSNKNITGYSIRVLDEDNNSVFESEYISPIEELQKGEMAQYYEPNGVNSGVNGTFLKIPFFQNYNKKMVDSYNAIYYKPKYMVDYLITNLELPEDYPDNSKDFCNPENWILLDTGNYRFNWEGVNSTLTSAEIQKLKEQNNIYLDGELILEGQTILVANNGLSGIVSGFYRILKKNGEYIQTELEPVSLDDWLTYSSISYQTVVARGSTLSNKVINKDEFNNFTYETNLFLWSNRDGVRIPNFCSGSTTYKWEVTLYQGEGVVSLVPYETWCINYDDLDVKYYDMTISSGTILGSNSERIQIADRYPWEAWGKPEVSLPSLKNGTLVLQGKYVSFGNSDLVEQFSTERFNIQTYDSTYGHVYPVENSAIGNMVNTYSKVRFYKYSTNPNDILTTDIVEYGLNKQISFVLCKVVKTDEKRYRGEVVSSFDNVSINNRLYGIDRSILEESCPTINSLISQYQKILITNNTKPYMNGVYTVYERDDIDFYNSEDVKINLNLVFLKRSASFNTWGSFIGKVIYVSTFCEADGSLVSTNIESLAGSSPDYNLWNPDNVESGDSNLYFSKERPILLFENLIYIYADLLKTELVTREIHVGDVVDGVVVKAGMKVVYSVSSTSPSGREWILSEITETGYKILRKLGDDGGSAYFSEGQNYGKLVVSLLSGGITQVTYKFHTAVILKNTKSYTFITPSLEVKTGMKLKLKGNNYVILDGETTSTQWISIEDYNNKVYCIKHEDLSTPESLVSEKSEKNKTPWKYEIRSFFKASDFNPFYCYENPYLILYKNGREYSSLSNIVGEQGIIANAVSEDNSSLIIDYYADSNVSFSNVLKLSAKYIQNQGVSWESYRWVLLDADGNILQDTGKKYDKDMSVLFYGLSCDSKINYSVYYATLYVEDDLKNLCVYTIRLIVRPGESKDSGIPFTAEYECGADAVKLSYGGNSKMMPSYRNLDGTVDSLYVESNFNFDKGITYTNGEGFSITNKNNSQERGVDYSKGSNISENDGSSAIYFSSISQGNKIGVPYYTSFNFIEPIQEVNKNNCFELTGQTDLNEDPGQLYFETEFSLNDNQCGHILDFMIEGVLEENNILSEPCYYDDGSINDLKGYLTFELSTNDNLISPFEYNTDRNKFNIKIKAYPLNNSFESNEWFLTLPFPLPTAFEKTNNYRYYIQKSNIIPSEENEYYETNAVAELYVKKDKDNKFFTSGTNDFGNLCLFSSNESSNGKFFYWVEDRPFLRSVVDTPDHVREYFDDYAETGIYSTGQFTYAQRTYHSDVDRKVLKWPDAFVISADWDEKNLYWNDEDLNNDQNTPMFWRDVTASTTGVQEVKTCPRHPGKSNNLFHVVIKINNVNELYKKIIINPLDVLYEIIYETSGHYKMNIYYLKDSEQIILCEFKIVKTTINE